VQRIAAGAVINEPCDVVRELVENALDANARLITVEIEPQARSIVVSDNGDGISLEAGLLHIAECNATSKIRSVEDLERIETLGFRGQGLWACASFAGELTVSSRTAEALDGGVQVRFASEGTAIPSSVSPAAIAVGSVIRACDMKLLDFSPKALRACKNWISTAAICHPRTRFVLKQRGKVSYASLPVTTAATKEGLANLLGKPAAHFRSGTANDPDLGSATVVVGLPSLVHYSSGNRITIAVNGRCVELPEVSAEVRSIFRSALPPRRYPGVFVHLTVMKVGACDWNVHPMKKTMRIGSTAVDCDVIPLVRVALNRALSHEPFAIGMQDSSDQHLFTSNSAGIPFHNPSSVIASVLASKRDNAWKTGNQENEDDRAPAGVFGLRAIAQVMQTYIVAEYGTGILLIEQHTAHERIRMLDNVHILVLFTLM
jgi:DNA mismatch repair protein MutL